MRKVFVVLVAFVLLCFLFVPYGCTDRKVSTADSIASDSLLVDTLGEDSTEQLIVETPMPKAADELFDDFIFNFAANRRLQKSRIVFPLPIYYGNKLAKHIPASQWRMEHFFMHQEYYTMIVDNKKQLELSKDTSINKVAIEKIFLSDDKVQRFIFDRIEGEWKMTSVVYQQMAQSHNASFLKFYNHFSTDSAFQVKSMAEEVYFTAPDPEDDFATMEGVIMPEQWPDFKPGLIPSGTLYNIMYGEGYRPSNRKSLVIRGISNGLEMEMTFKLLDGQWKLVRFNS